MWFNIPMQYPKRWKLVSVMMYVQNCSIQLVWSLGFNVIAINSDFFFAMMLLCNHRLTVYSPWLRGFLNSAKTISPSLHAPRKHKYYIKHIHKTPTENPNSNWRYPQIQKEKDCTKTTRLRREVGAGNVRNLAPFERKKKETRSSRAPACPPLRTLPRASCHELLVTVAVCEKRWTSSTSSIHEGRQFLGGYFYQF